MNKFLKNAAWFCKSAALEVDLEESEVVGHPPVWRLESETVRVHNREHTDFHRSVRYVRATSATVVGQLNLQEILVGHELAVYSGLCTSHHVPILRGDLNRLTLLLLFIGHLISDRLQVEHHFSLPVALAEIGSFHFLLTEFFDMSVSVTAKNTCGFDVHSLLNPKLNSGNFERALGVVNVNHGFSHLNRCKPIFLEGSPHFGSALVNAAPSSDSRIFKLLLVLLEFLRLLPNNHNLLVLHVVFRKPCIQNGFDPVLYLCLWLLAAVVVLEVN